MKERERYTNVNDEIVACIDKAKREEIIRTREIEARQKKQKEDEQKVKDDYVNEIKAFFHNLPIGSYDIALYTWGKREVKDHWYSPTLVEGYKIWIDDRFSDMGCDKITITKSYGYDDITITKSYDVLSSYTMWSIRSDPYIRDWNPLEIIAVKDNLELIEKKIGELYGCVKK